MPKGYEKADSPVGGICDAIRAGVPLARAAKLGGISVQTLLRWDAESPVVHAQLEAAQAAARAPQPRELPPGWAEAVAISAGTDAPEPTPSPEADRWARIREEAAALAPGLAGLYRWVDGLLASKGFPPTSPWWRSTLEAFWASDARWLVILAGRGAGKSSTLCRIAVVEALFAELDKGVAEGANPLRELLLRGKVAYLFQRYSAERELSAAIAERVGSTSAVTV